MFIADSNKCIAEETHFTKYAAGAELNVAIGLTRLGYEVDYITAVGEDPFGEYIIKFMHENQISTQYIDVQKNRTGFLIKNREKDEIDAQVVYFRDFTPATMVRPEVLDTINFDDYALVHITGIFSLLSENNFEFIKELIKRCKEKNIKIVFDPNCRTSMWVNYDLNIERLVELASMSDIFLPGLSEIKLLSKTENLDEAIEFFKDKVKVLILKDGTTYSHYIEADKKVSKECFKVKVVDTVGAGDGFAVGIISSYLEGLDPKDMLTRANAIGAIQVCNRGDNEGLPTRKILEEFIKNH